MIRSIAIAVCLMLPTSVSGEPLAKRQGPKPVTPVVHEGVKYLSPNNSGLEGIVEARKADTGEKLWDAVVYTVKIDPDLEGDVQWSFITTLELSDGKLLIANEDGEHYLLDLKTKKAERVKDSEESSGAHPFTQTGLDQPICSFSWMTRR